MTDTQTKLVTLARSLVGVPYKYGATKDDIPHAFDCSLFIQYIFAEVGIALPRSTIQQAEIGVEVPDLSRLEVGDLIFLHGTIGHYNTKFPAGIGHVVMYIGDDKVIHAGSIRIQEKPVVIERGEVGISPLAEIIETYKPVIHITRPLHA